MRDFNQGDERPHQTALHSEKIVGDRKTFFLDLRQNERGRFIKITEEVRGNRDTIMLPMESALEFSDALQRILDVEAQLE